MDETCSTHTFYLHGTAHMWIRSESTLSDFWMRQHMCVDGTVHVCGSECMGQHNHVYGWDSTCVDGTAHVWIGQHMCG